MLQGDLQPPGISFASSRILAHDEARSAGAKKAALGWKAGAAQSGAVSQSRIHLELGDAAGAVELMKIARSTKNTIESSSK